MTAVIEIGLIVMIVFFTLYIALVLLAIYLGSKAVGSKDFINSIEVEFEEVKE